MFRAKTKDGKEVKGYLVGAGLYYDYKYILPIEKPQNSGFPSPIIQNGCTSIGGFVEIDPRTLAQDTTVKDKNGTLLFAGDKIKSGKVVLVVEWDKRGLRWITRNPIDGEIDSLSIWDLSNRFEVIGSQAEEKQ